MLRRDLLKGLGAFALMATSFGRIEGKNLSGIKKSKTVKHTLYLWPEGSEADYNSKDYGRQRIEVSLVNQKEPAPFVLICPGGGYAKLSTEKEGSKFVDLFNQAGFSAGYLISRVGKKYYPQPQHDALRALRLVHKNAADWGIKPDKVAIMGFSAGGHLAASVTVVTDHPTNPADDLEATIKPTVSGLILAYPVLSFKEEAHPGSIYQLLGMEPEPALLDKLNLPQQVTSALCPTYIFHTSPDKSVPLSNSTRFAEACARVGVPITLNVFPNGKHGSGLAHGLPLTEQWPSNMLDWFKNWVGLGLPTEEVKQK